MQTTQPRPSEATGQPLLAELDARGITVTVDGADLRFTGPAGSLTPELKSAIRDQTAALLVALTGFAPLDDVIVRSETARHPPEKIERCVDLLTAQAAAPEATPLDQQVLRDWIAFGTPSGDSRQVLNERERPGTHHRTAGR